MAHVPETPESIEYQHEQEIHHSHWKQYVGIFFLLLVVTIAEVLLPISSESLGIPKILEITLLLTLMVFKGTFVAMFYMHLKGDRRTYGMVFVLPLIIAALLFVFAFVLLFQPTLW